MITEIILNFLVGIADALLSFLPHVDTPDWLDQDSALVKVFTYAGQMGAWFPTDLALQVLLGVLAVWGIAFTIKIIRIIASFLTAGGGSAA